ncbi:hypothetical protein JTB14_004078 [Gonioctena quinquepunctata]|nr:hypothetical protein JTB14_004078 [Gonioctena quinquepunctata]
MSEIQKLNHAELRLVFILAGHCSLQKASEESRGGHSVLDIKVAKLSLLIGQMWSIRQAEKLVLGNTILHGQYLYSLQWRPQLGPQGGPNKKIMR